MTAVNPLGRRPVLPQLFVTYFLVVLDTSVMRNSGTW
jgi:hypothetical protein